MLALVRHTRHYKTVLVAFIALGPPLPPQNVVVGPWQGFDVPRLFFNSHTDDILIVATGDAVSTLARDLQPFGLNLGNLRLVAFVGFGVDLDHGGTFVTPFNASQSPYLILNLLTAAPRDGAHHRPGLSVSAAPSPDRNANAMPPSVAPDRGLYGVELANPILPFYAPALVALLLLNVVPADWSVSDAGLDVPDDAIALDGVLGLGLNNSRGGLLLWEAYIG